MLSATNGLYWGFHNIQYRRHGLSRLYGNGFFSEDPGFFNSVLAAPQFWRVNSCPKECGLYTRKYGDDDNDNDDDDDDNNNNNNNKATNNDNAVMRAY
jgi:hypothetical protein